MIDVQEAQRVLQIEAQAIQDLNLRLNQAMKSSFTEAIEKMASCTGKIIITGMGKSGFIARKFASTLSSTGTPAIYVHPAECSHGDMGVITSQDLPIVISYSGESPELADIIKYLNRREIQYIAMTGNLQSSLASTAKVILDVSISKEACPLNLAPTASTTVTLALGDAMAMTLMKQKGFRSEDFAEYHPGGRLGRRLLTRVKDVMHAGDSLPVVTKPTNMKEVIFKMTAKEVRGVAGVVDEQGNLLGIITDGDLRRRLDKSQNPLEENAGNIMSLAPKTIDMNESAEKALFLMEQFSIQTLFVIDGSSSSPKKPVGIMHLQDLLKANIK